MNIVSHTHPAWCDPRMCDPGGGGIDHRGDPLAWTVTDHRITVLRSRYDEVLTSGEQLVGPDRVTVHVEDEASATAAGEILSVELDLTGSDARLLAAALGQVAERIAADYRGER